MDEKLLRRIIKEEMKPILEQTGVLSDFMSTTTEKLEKIQADIGWLTLAVARNRIDVRNLKKVINKKTQVQTS